MRHTRISATLLTMVVAVLAVGPACQGSSTPASGDKTIVYSTPSLALTMDPCFLPGQQTAEIVQNLYWEWTNYAVVPGPNGIMVDDTKTAETNMKPGVLDSWQVSSDQMTWTLHIHKGVKDSYGNTLKADDMRWILDRTRHSGGCSFVADAENIKDVGQQVKVLDDYTLQVTLPAPDPIFLRALNVNNGMAFGPEARKHTTADDPWAYEWMKRNAPAIGPYKLEKWTPGVEQVLVRNPNWFGPKAAIGRIVYRQVPEAANRVALLLSDQAQIARDLTQDQLDEINKNGKSNVKCIAANQFVYVALNFAQGRPTSDLRVRQALAYAAPYNDFINSTYRARAKRLYGMITPAYVDYIGDDKYPFATDVDKAKSLLAQAGFASGFDASILVDAGVPEHERIAVLLQDSFKKIGVNLSIDKKPTSAFQDAAFGRKFGDMVLDQNYAFILDPDYHALVWLPNSPPPNFNFGAFANPEFNKLQADGVGTPAGPTRSGMMGRMQSVFNEQLPWLSVANAPTCFAFSKNLSGYAWHTHNQIIFTDLKAS